MMQVTMQGTTERAAGAKWAMRTRVRMLSSLKRQQI